MNTNEPDRTGEQRCVVCGKDLGSLQPHVTFFVGVRAFPLCCPLCQHAYQSAPEHFQRRAAAHEALREAERQLGLTESPEKSRGFARQSAADWTSSLPSSQLLKILMPAKPHRPLSPLRALLLTWRVPVKSDPSLARRVWTRLRREIPRLQPHRQR